MARTLYVVLMNGSRRLENGELTPSDIAKKRATVGLVAAAEQVEKTGKNSVDVLFLGGQRDDPMQSEAAVAYRWVVDNDHTPGWAAKRIENYGGTLYRLAESRYTAGDMVTLTDWLTGKDYGLVILISHRDHIQLAYRTLSACEDKLGPDFGTTCIDSGETAPYSARQLKILKWVYDHDPCWTKWYSWPLRVLANRRGRNE